MEKGEGGGGRSHTLQDQLGPKTHSLHTITNEVEINKSSKEFLLQGSIHRFSNHTLSLYYYLPTYCTTYMHICTGDLSLSLV